MNLVGKVLKKPLQGDYEIKDFAHGHYYLVRIKDGYDTFERAEYVEREYAEQVEIENRKKTKFPCEEFFIENGTVVDFAIHDEYGSFFEIYTHAVPNDSFNVDSALVWHKDLKLGGYCPAFINDMNVVEIEMKISSGYSMYHTFKRNPEKENGWEIEHHGFEYNQTNVTPEMIVDYVARMKHQLFKNIFSYLNESELWISGKQFGDNNYCLHYKGMYDHNHDSYLNITGGNIRNGRYRGWHEKTYAVPKKQTPATRLEIVTLLTNDVEEFCNKFIELTHPPEPER